MLMLMTVLCVKSLTVYCIIIERTCGGRRPNYLFRPRRRSITSEQYPNVLIVQKREQMGHIFAADRLLSTTSPRELKIKHRLVYSVLFCGVGVATGDCQAGAIAKHRRHAPAANACSFQQVQTLRMGRRGVFWIGMTEM